MSHPNPDLIALGIRQPWAELIVRGAKTIEVRSQPTNVRGRIYVYASKKIAEHPGAMEAVERHDLDLDALPRGVLVGTVTVLASRAATAADAGAACVPPQSLRNRYAWVLAEPQRLPDPLPVRFLPYGVWFYPFRRMKER
ncbi:MAG: ASCH domain-containing protein [Planctomycetaceae bacterium]